MLKLLKNGYFSQAALIAAVVVMPALVSAEENIAPQDPSPAVAEQTEPSPGPGPKLMELEAYTGNLLQGLEPYQAQYIYQIRTEFGVVRSIQVARTDIENAVKSCGAEHADLKEPMESRFNDWNDAVVPKLSVADVALKEAIQRQSFRPTVRVNMLLDHVQAAFEERDTLFKRVPVTTKDACQSLLESMDNTEESLKALLDATISNLNTLSTDAPETAAVEEESAQPAEPTEN